MTTEIAHQPRADDFLRIDPAPLLALESILVAPQAIGWRGKSGRAWKTV
jgi:hypothetical protein